MIPKQFCCDQAVLKNPLPSIAMTSVGPPNTRFFDMESLAVQREMFQRLPDGVDKERVRDAVAEKGLFKAGVEFAIGRVMEYYPKKGARLAKPVLPSEARKAWRQQGTSLESVPDALLLPYPLVAPEGSACVKVTRDSGNGLPVLKSWDDPETHQVCLELTMLVRAELEAVIREPDGVRRWLRTAEVDRPWLVASVGKCKTDYYSVGKVEKKAMRYYHNMPRQITLNIMRASQALDAVCKSILEDPLSTTFSGMSLVGGGADKLVTEMDRRLLENGFAYVTMGDDSFVVVALPGGRLLIFALDGSSFDLTLHRQATQAIHMEQRQTMSHIDKVAAHLQYELNRERLVVTVGSMTRRWYHAGPSGMMGQSKVNGAVMSVAIDRVLGRLEQYLVEAVTEDILDAIIQEEGKAMGLVIRLEQFHSVVCDNLRDFLREYPFTFVGYQFTTDEEGRSPCRQTCQGAWGSSRSPKCSIIGRGETWMWEWH